MFAVWIFLSISSISALQDEFQTVSQTDTGICDLCDEINCTALSIPICNYYEEISDNPNNVDDHIPEDNDLNYKIDNMILDYVERASTNFYEECVPILSQYTNCNRDNVYMGCILCNCDVFGKWNCTVQSCNVNDNINVDHNILSSVLKKLQQYTNLDSKKRSRRSTNEISNDKISYEDLLKWYYGVTRFDIKNIENNSRISDAQNNTENNKETFDDKLNKDLESDLLVFDDILKNIIVVKNDRNDKKVIHSEDIYYKSDDPVLVELTNGIGNFNVQEVKDLKISEDIIGSKADENVKEFTGAYSNEYEKSTNDSNENKHILKKREISLDANETVVPSVNNSSIIRMEDLQNNILSSLNHIINEKQNELEKLTNIKEQMILYLKSFGNISIPNDFNPNNVTNHSKDAINSNIYFYQFENPREDFRKRNQNILEKYRIKLKRDIYEVIRDISGIQRLTNTSIPQDLKILIRAMKYYVNKENERKKVKETKHKSNLLRTSDLNQEKEFNNQPLNIIIDMLEILNNDIHTHDILESISRNARQIINRIIKQFYVTHFPISGSKIFDPKSDVLNDLRVIGDKWQNLIVNFQNISAQDRLYSLKHIHIILSKDICKLTNILILMEFANTRRMALVDTVSGKKALFKISNDLQNVNRLINNIINIDLKTNLKGKKYQVKDNNKNTIKKSLFQKIKTLLKTSKKEIQNLFHRNISKSEIVKHIAKKKLEEIRKKKLNDYKTIMERWQNNMQIRNRRSAGEFKKFFNNIKHIIPKYLRGKVKPAIDRSKNKSRQTTRKAKHHGRGKKKHSTTTPKVRSSKHLQNNVTKQQH